MQMASVKRSIEFVAKWKRCIDFVSKWQRCRIFFSFSGLVCIQILNFLSINLINNVLLSRLKRYLAYCSERCIKVLKVIWDTLRKWKHYKYYNHGLKRIKIYTYKWTNNTKKLRNDDFNKLYLSFIWLAVIKNLVKNLLSSSIEYTKIA